MSFRQPLGAILDLIPNILPIDLEAGDNEGDTISLKNAAGVLCVLFAKYAAGGTDDITLSFLQNTNVGNSPADEKVLGNVITKYWKKQAATVLTGTGTWTEVTQTADDEVVINANGQSVLVAVYIDAADLDVANRFDCLRMRIADPGSGGAYIGGALYIPVGLTYPSAPDKLPNMIID